MYQLLMLISLLALPLTLFGDEFVSEAEVIHSEPITTTHLVEDMAPACLKGEPDAGSIETLLNWDVGCEAARELVVTGYRVQYRFRGETFTMMADQEPGATIPVRITLN